MTAYLNWAMLSKPSGNVKQCVQGFGKNPLIDVHGARATLRSILAKRMEVDADRIVFAYNTTEAMALASRLLDFKLGKNKVITSDFEYVSILNVLTNPDYEEANRNLVTYHSLGLSGLAAHMPHPNNGKADFVWGPDEGEGLLAELLGNAGESPLLLLSEVQRTTGRRIAVGEMCRKAKERRATAIVDAAQIIAPHSLQGIDFDAYVGCFHKHFGGAPALGFLVVSLEILQKFGARLLRKIETGATIYAPAVAAATEALLEIDWKNAEERIREMSSLLVNAITGLGFGVLRTSGEYASHIISFKVGEKSKDAAEALNKNGWVVSYLPEIDAVRVSINARNTYEEMEGFADAVAKLSDKACEPALQRL